MPGSPTNVVNTARGALGAAVRWNPDRVPERTRDLRAAKLEAHIAKVVAEFPPLSEDQIARVARVLYGSASISAKGEAA